MSEDAIELRCPRGYRSWLLGDGTFVPFVEIIRAGTLPMAPALDLGYDPLPLIDSGHKTHTLRGQSRRVGAIAEITCGGKRTGLIVRFTASTRMTPDEYLTDEFAWADGIRPEQGSPAEAMRALIARFYPDRALPDRWRLDFEVLVALQDMPSADGGTV